MLRWLRRLIVLCLALALLWLAGLAVLGELGGRRAALHLQATLAGALGAKVRIGGVDLGLVRGRFTLVELELDRRALGAMHLTVHKAEVDTAPLGLVLWQRDRARRLRVDGAELSLSSWAVLAPAPGGLLRFPIAAFELRALTVTLAPTLLAPTLGAATLTIDRARGRGLVVRSAVSWLLALEELDAHAELPGGATATITYRGAPAGPDGQRRGTLTLRSSLLARELALPITLPAVIDGDELAALRQLGGRLVREVTKRKAAELLKSLGR